MRRSIILLTIALPLLWVTFGRSPVISHDRRPDAPITISREAIPSTKELSPYLGSFQLEGAWRIQSDNPLVYGFSGLVVQPGKRLIAFSDAGATLSFGMPDQESPEAHFKPDARRLVFNQRAQSKAGRDVESVTYDPHSNQFWLGMEGSNRIIRLAGDLEETGRVKPDAMANWGINSGPEALMRIPAEGKDKRDIRKSKFITIREVRPDEHGARYQEGLMFSGDPISNPKTQQFWFEGPENFAVVDMAMMPDGRALILMRRLIWPAPMRYAGRIVVADTKALKAGEVWKGKTVAYLASTLPIDNFEGIAIDPRSDGKLNVWLISDDNDMTVLQRTLLWKMVVDPVDLP